MGNYTIEKGIPIPVGYKRTSIGYYTTKEEAADARNQKAFEMFGDFARFR